MDNENIPQTAHQDGDKKKIGGTLFKWDSNVGPSGSWTADSQASAESKAGKQAQVANDVYGIANSNSKSGTNKSTEGKIVNGRSAFGSSDARSPEEELEDLAGVN